MTTPRTLLVCFACLVAACSNEGSGGAAATKPSPPSAKKETQLPPLETDNIVSIAVGSKDHTTLVAALKAADYVKSVASTGPLTVFAPTNAAFANLPAGTLDSLMKPENQDALKEIIKYHATTTAYEQSSFKDGEQLAMANGKKVTFHVADGKVKVDDANITASIRGSNGIVHIIDAVLLPPKD